jgi:hypothetical protein
LNYFKDIIFTNQDAIDKTRSNISKDPKILLMGIAYAFIGLVLVFVLNILLAGPLVFFGGFITIIVESALISSYLYTLNNVITYNRFRWQNIKYGFTYYIWKVYGVLFIFYITTLLLNLVGGFFGTLFYRLQIYLPLIVLLVFNPLPEVIYGKERDSLETVLYCIEFMKENWVTWLIPNVILMLLIYVTMVGVSSVIYFNVRFLGLFIRLIITSVLLSAGMLYRGHLFKLLSSSTMRKRQFMRRF